MDRNNCGALKWGGRRCNNPKGFGTDHEGEGLCRFHNLDAKKYKSIKIPGGEGCCRSRIEYRAYNRLHTDPSVVKIIYEPRPYIPYENQGKKSEYKPDFLVEYKKGRKEIIEVKMAHSVDSEENRAKFIAASKCAKKKNMKFIVWAFNNENKRFSIEEFKY